VARWEWDVGGVSGLCASREGVLIRLMFSITNEIRSRNLLLLCAISSGLGDRSELCSVKIHQIFVAFELAHLEELCYKLTPDKKTP